MEKKIQEKRMGNREWETFILHSPFSILHSTRRGVATLPTVMVLGVISLAIAVAITSVALSEAFTSQGSIQSQKALFYAESGARDALIKIARNNSYTCTATDCYLIDFSASGCSSGNDCAKVSVSGTATAKTVTSKGIMKSSTRTLQVNVTLGVNGDISTSTPPVWSEVTT